MKISSILLFTALAVPAFSQTVFKPGDTIPMTVKFDSAVEPGAKVSVRYDHPAPPPPDQTTFGCRLNFEEHELSSDNKTFALQASVVNECPSGEYAFGLLQITKEGSFRVRATLLPTRP